MTKREYAEKVADIVGGKVKEVEKTNGIKMLGIIKNVGNISPVVYIDQAYEEDVAVEKIAKEIMRIFDAHNYISIDTSFFEDFDKVKDNIVLRLYNEKTNAPIFRIADDFDDLILVPYIDNINLGLRDGTGAIKITPQLLKSWGKTENEIFELGMENVTVSITPMVEIMAEMMGFDPADIETDMFIISNKENNMGAVAIIKAKKQLQEMFPNGYIVLPSSIHEVIVIPKDVGDTDAFTTMVREINGSSVAPDERLSDKVYEF